MGSTTQSQSLFSPRSPPSSPIRLCWGKASATLFAINRSDSTSAAVTRSWGDALVRISVPSLRPFNCTSRAASAAFLATAAISFRLSIRPLYHRSASTLSKIPVRMFRLPTLSLTGQPWRAHEDDKLFWVNFTFDALPFVLDELAVLETGRTLRGRNFQTSPDGK